jgi:hypothetical protein
MTLRRIKLPDVCSRLARRDDERLEKVCDDLDRIYLNMLFGLMTGVGEQDNPADEGRWNAVFVILNACVPENGGSEGGSPLGNGRRMVRFELDDFRQGSFEEPHARVGLCGSPASLKYVGSRAA